MEGESDASLEHRWRLARSKEFLKPDRNSRRSWVAVVDRKPRTCWRLEVRRREIVEATTLRPIEQSKQRAGNVERPEPACRSNLTQCVVQPDEQRLGQRRIRHVGPGGIVRVKEGDSLPQLQRAVRPVKDGETLPPDGIGDRFGDEWRIGITQRRA